MTKKQAERYVWVKNALISMGVDHNDADALFKIERTLSRWSEQECGDEYGNAIERDDETGKPFRTYERGDGKRGRYAIPDRERGALRRLDTIMSRYPELVAYNQGDPRGCALYIVKKANLPRVDPSSPMLKDERTILSGYYTRGVGVCYE